MNRFTQHRIILAISPSGIWQAASVFLAVVCVIFFAAGAICADSASQEREAASLEKTVRRSIAQCYAVEGAYPPGLDYLRKHYGLAYDERRFYIDYTAIGSNIMPDVTILPRSKNETTDTEGGLP